MTPLPDGARLEPGRPLPFLDDLARALGLANKALFLSARFEDHLLPAASREGAEAFLREHALSGLCVRFNQYAPLDDLRRLLSNGRVNLLLRLFFGLPQWSATALFPGRVFGGDHYNPWSDTVHLFSGHPGIVLHELGHALDFRRRAWPGLYALTRLVPGLALYQEYLASRYAIEFLRRHGRLDEELDALRVLYPAYSTYVFGALVELFPSAGVRSFFLPVIALGHLLGNEHARRRAAEAGGPGLADQWRSELDRARAELSPASPRGRSLWGTFLGMAAGSTLCGPGTLIGAWVGHRLTLGPASGERPAGSPPPGPR